MNNKKLQKPLYIPYRVKIYNEPIKGYSDKVFKNLVLSIVIASLVYILLGSITKDVEYTIFFWMITVGVLFFILRENELNINVIDYLNILFSFQRTQLKYRYEYKDFGGK